MNIITITSDPKLVPPHIVLKDREIFCYIKNNSYHKEKGLAVVITHSRIILKDCGNGGKSKQKVVILVHGHLSHKNAIYQPLLADILSYLGYSVIRFDFRSQGDSEENKSIEVGRTIEQDIEDLETIIRSLDAQYCSDIEEVFGDIQLNIEMVIAHSRGVLPVMSYFSNAGNLYCIPYIVNCCGRYFSEGLLRRYSNAYPRWKELKGFATKTFRFGEYVDYWVPSGEILSAGNFSTDHFKDISQETRIINVYGSCDAIVPIDDAEQYYRIFEDRADYYLITGGDHNFYGLPDDKNELQLPIRRGKVNYSYYLAALIYIGISANSFINITELEIRSILPMLKDLRL